MKHPYFRSLGPGVHKLPDSTYMLKIARDIIVSHSTFKVVTHLLILYVTFQLHLFSRYQESNLQEILDIDLQVSPKLTQGQGPAVKVCYYETLA